MIVTLRLWASIYNDYSQMQAHDFNACRSCYVAAALAGSETDSITTVFPLWLAESADRLQMVIMCFWKGGSSESFSL